MNGMEVDFWNFNLIVGIERYGGIGVIDSDSLSPFTFSALWDCGMLCKGQNSAWISLAPCIFSTWSFAGTTTGFWPTTCLGGWSTPSVWLWCALLANFCAWELNLEPSQWAWNQAPKWTYDDFPLFSLDPLPHGHYFPGIFCTRRNMAERRGGP